MFPEFKIVLQLEIHLCKYMNERIQENEFPDILNFMEKNDHDKNLQI